MTPSPESGLVAECSTIPALMPKVVLHYDIAANQGTVRRHLDRHLFGFKETRTIQGIRKTYSYSGLLSRVGGRRLGQSVILLSPEAAVEAVAFFEELHVDYERLDVCMSPGDSRVRGVV